jgi:hypothetical protein
MMNDESVNSLFIIHHFISNINISLKHISFFGVIFEFMMEQAQTNKMIPNSIKAFPFT